MVHACGVQLRVTMGCHRAAPNRFTRSRPRSPKGRTRSRFTRVASETSPCRRAGHSWSANSISEEERRPGGVAAGIETRGRSASPLRRIGSVRGGLGRRAASAGSKKKSKINSGRRPGGQSKRVGSRPRRYHANRGRRECPSSARSSPGRAGVFEVTPSCLTPRGSSVFSSWRFWF